MTPADLQRIAFVTSRFREVQGLRSAMYGATLLVGVTIYSFVEGGFFTSGMGVVMLASVAGGAMVRALDPYYQRTFGRAPSRSTPTGREVGGVSEFAAQLLISGLLVDVMLGAFLNLRVSVGAAGLLVWSLWVLIRDWPHRSHYSIGVLAALGASVALMMAPAKDYAARGLLDPRVDPYYALACSIIGLTLVATGLLDHRLLVRAMWRPIEGVRTPPLRLARIRIVLSVSAFVALVLHLVLLDWPTLALTVVLVLWVPIFLLVLVAHWPEFTVGYRTFTEAQRAREAALLARIREAPAPRVVEDSLSAIPTPDFWGHLVLPMAMAAGAMIDIPLRGHGFPSALALSLAASQLRIATRDWPARGHYVIGFMAALAAAVSHMVIGRISATDWAFSALLLISAAMLVEGWLDRGREREVHCALPDGHHANTV